MTSNTADAMQKEAGGNEFLICHLPTKDLEHQTGCQQPFQGRSVCMTFVMVKLLSLCWSTLVFPVLELPGKGGWVMPHRPSWCLLPLLSAGSGFRALSVPEESHMQYSRANIWLGGLWNKWTHLILQYPCCTSRSGCCGVQQDKFPDLSEPWIQLL